MMDKNTLNFLNLAKSTDPNRPNIQHLYASERHIVGIDGHRMHYVDNFSNYRGYLSTLPIDEQFVAYQRLIMSLPFDSYSAIKFSGSGKDDVDLWKSALKDIRTFDHAFFEMREGTLFLCAKNHDRRTIQKSLSMPIKDCKVAYGFVRSPTMNAEYLSDALSPITHKRLAVRNAFSFYADISEKHPLQLRVETPDGIFRSVLMTIREPKESTQAQAA